MTYDPIDPMTMAIPSNFILIISIISAIYYGFFWLSREIRWRRTLYKTIPVALLAISAAMAGLHLFLVLALFLSAVGDAFLSRTGKAAFLAGLSSFLLAHLAYAWLFVNAPGSESHPYILQLIITLMVFASITTVLKYLWDHLQDLKLAVLVYIAAIATMILTALFSGQNYLLLSGVILFAVSDAVLAFNEFYPLDKNQQKLAANLVWIFYYLAQLLIVISYF